MKAAGRFFAMFGTVTVACIVVIVFLQPKQSQDVRIRLLNETGRATRLSIFGDGITIYGEKYVVVPAHGTSEEKFGRYRHSKQGVLRIRVESSTPQKWSTITVDLEQPTADLTIRADGSVTRR